MEIIKRLKNPGTVIAVVGMAGLLANQFGVNIDIEWLDTTVKLVCAIFVVLGVMNNPSTSGISINK